MLVSGPSCSPSGFAVVRWCGTYSGCSGGCSVIEQTSQAPYPGGQCPYSVQTEYHAYAYPSVACLAGYTFTGPLNSDCLKPEKAQAVTASKPQLGDVSKFAARSCAAEPSKASALAPTVAQDSSLVGNPCGASTCNKLHAEVDFASGFGVPSIAAASGYVGYQLGTNAQQTKCGCQ